MRKIFFVFFGLLAVAVILVAVTKLNFFKTNKSEYAKMKTQNGNIPKATPQDTEDYLLYENPKYHYQVRYYKDWVKQGENEPPYPPPPEGMNFHRKETNPSMLCAFDIQARKESGAFDLEAESQIQDHDADVVVNQHDSTRYLDQGISFTKDNDFQKVYTLYVKTSNGDFRIGYNYVKTDFTKMCQPIFDTMLSSFTIDY